MIPAAAATTRRGIAASLLSSAGFSSMDATTKVLLETMPANAAVLLRTALIVAVLLVGLLATRSWRLLATDARLLTTLRALMFAATSVLIVHSLQRLELARTIAIFFVSPVFTVLLAALMLGERITPAALVSALLGFVGVWLIMRPGPQGFEWSLLLPLAAALTSALQDILARRLRGRTHAVGLLAWSMLATLAACLLLSSGDLLDGRLPAPPDTQRWFLLAICVITGIVGYFFVIVSFQLAPTGLIAPLRYLNLAWAVLFGYLLWNALPDGRTWAGITLILLAGGLCVAPAFGAALQARYPRGAAKERP